MEHESLCLFKSSRRTEYTQENLRILSGAIGDELEVGYKERWLSEDIRRRLPGAGEQVLVVLADLPYAKSHPIRRAEAIESAFTDDTLRLRLRLGSRVLVDQNRWRPLVEAGPNPLTSDFGVRIAVPDGIIEDVDEPERELRAWKKQIDAISHADGYARVAFLRIGAVSEVGGDLVERPYRLISKRTHELDLIAYNPHLPPVTLEALRLVPLPDSSLVDVAMDEQPIPADGTIELVLVPQDEGDASLEFNVSRGVEFWFALQFDWKTTPAQPAQGAPAAPGPAAASPTGLAAVPAGSSVPGLDASDRLGTHLLRAYQLLRGHAPVAAGVRLRVLDELLRAAPGDERLLEQRAIVLHEMRQWPEAAALLEDLPAGVLSPEGRTMLVSSWFMQGRAAHPASSGSRSPTSRETSGSSCYSMARAV